MRHATGDKRMSRVLFSCTFRLVARNKLTRISARGAGDGFVYNFNHNFPKINLDSSFGFSRRTAETAEYAEKVPKTEAFRSPAHTLRQKTDSPKW